MNGVLSQMSWDDLIKMRLQDPTNQALAAPEHRAYAREQVQQNPWMAPVMGILAPGYQAYKMMAGPGQGTPASWDQLKQSYMGIGEGLKRGILGR
jgi:hypothetical protein